MNTNDEERDTHLRSPDFFDADAASADRLQLDLDHGPTDDDTFEITGDLTLRGVTRELTLRAEVTGTEEDPWGNERVGLEVTGAARPQ